MPLTGVVTSPVARKQESAGLVEDPDLGDGGDGIIGIAIDETVAARLSVNAVALRVEGGQPHPGRVVTLSLRDARPSRR